MSYSIGGGGSMLAVYKSSCSAVTGSVHTEAVLG